ncbi:hypothetical protein [Prevotella sp. kh1p2]|uniref:hypothetical protein n=1 Tax=Prevotella sp. kh1p2 TaxID=1761883 RepID=UPI000B86327C|nr:hypothetical protein [Prevotella sp. kh1p2]
MLAALWKRISNGFQEGKPVSSPWKGEAEEGMTNQQKLNHLPAETQPSASRNSAIYQQKFSHLPTETQPSISEN